MLSFAALTGGDDFSDIDDRDGAPFPTEGQGRGGGTRGRAPAGLPDLHESQGERPLLPGRGGPGDPRLTGAAG